MNQFWRYLAAARRDFRLGGWRAMSRISPPSPCWSAAAPGRRAADQDDFRERDARRRLLVYDWDALGYAYADLVRRSPRRRPALQVPRDGQPTTTTATRSTTPCSAPTPAARLGAHPPRHLGGAPSRTLRHLGQHLVQRPCLNWHAPRQGRQVACRCGDGEDPADQRDPRQGPRRTPGRSPPERSSPRPSRRRGRRPPAQPATPGALVDNAVATYLPTVPGRRSGNRADRVVPAGAAPVPLHLRPGAGTCGGARPHRPDVHRCCDAVRRVAPAGDHPLAALTWRAQPDRGGRRAPGRPARPGSSGRAVATSVTT